MKKLTTVELEVLVVVADDGRLGCNKLGLGVLLLEVAQVQVVHGVSGYNESILRQC